MEVEVEMLEIRAVRLEVVNRTVGEPLRRGCRGMDASEMGRG